MRYWICRTPGKVEGPFEYSIIESMKASGEVTGSLQICPEGSEQWQTLDSLLVESQAETTPPTDSTTPATESSQAMMQYDDQSEVSAPIAYLSFSFANAFAVGWKGFTENYGLLLGVSFLILVANLLPTLITLPINLAAGGANNSMAFIVMNQVFTYGWSILVVLPLSLGGIWLGVKIARGEEAVFSDCWIAYQRLGWVILGALLTYLLLLIIYIIAGICGGLPGLIIGLLIGLIGGSTELAIGCGLVIGTPIAICAILYGMARIILMLMPIIDPKMGRMSPPDAMTWAFKRSGTGIAWSLVGLMIVGGLILGLSFASCILPYIFLGLPLMQAVMGAAYALITSQDIDGMLCEHCGYARQGNDSPQCPECGNNWKIGARTA